MRKRPLTGLLQLRVIVNRFLFTPK